MRTLDVADLDLESPRPESCGEPIVLTIRENPVAILSTGDPFAVAPGPPRVSQLDLARLSLSLRRLPAPFGRRLVLARGGRPIAELIPLQSIDELGFDSGDLPSAGVRTIDVDAMDAEDLAYCLDAEFWRASRPAATGRR